METKKYSLPSLPYGYDDLKPYISEEQLSLHHQKHHQAYVNGANAIFDKIETARKEGADLDIKATLKELSFNISGHILHSLFWENMAPVNNGGGGEPSGELAEAIRSEFGSLERFKKEFSQAAISVEGSGWAVLTWCSETQRPIIAQVEKHNVNAITSFKILAVLDVFEHAYYLDYKNERAKFVEAFWNIINWKKIEERFKT
jgi:superoxide dismutase, Fe-Mn family